MADQKLTQLDPLPDPMVGTDLLYVVRPSDPAPGFKATADQLLAFIPPAVIAWGDITGTLSNQTDLQGVLDTKVDLGDIVGNGQTMTGPGILGSEAVGVSSIAVITIGTGLDLTGGVLSATGGAAVWGAITGTLSDQTDLQAALDAKQATGNYITALTGDVTASGPGSVAATVVRINGVSLAGLATGILKNTTGTGAPSIAVAGDFPTLNQNTTGSAATLTTPRNINGVAFNGSADITVTAAAGTLSGTTLAATVVTSSLTAVGDLVTGSIGTGFVVKGVTMTLGSDANYDMYYRNASGVLTRLANGTTGDVLKATTGSAPSWGSGGGGSGTVTNTGTLTSNAVVLGNGGVDVKVVAGITTDGTSMLTLGVNTTTLGKVKLFGNTSGDATIQPAAVAGTATVVTLPNASSTLPIFGQQITFVGPTAARTITLPDAAFTVARTDAANTFTGVQTMTSPAFLTSATLDGVEITPEIRQNVQSGSYTCVLSDANKHIYTTTGTTATWTIPANSSVAYPIGTTLVFLMDATGTRTIAITSDTLFWAPSGATGSRTLTGIGVATAIKVNTTRWVISGVGLT